MSGKWPREEWGEEKSLQKRWGKRQRNQGAGYIFRDVEVMKNDFNSTGSFEVGGKNRCIKGNNKKGGHTKQLIHLENMFM